MIVDTEAMKERVIKYVAEVASAIHDTAFDIATEHTSFNETHDTWYNTDLEEVTELVRKELERIL